MKTKILNKATDMFLNYGFKSVTMDDLANEMGISKKTIYTHFENKTKLVEQCTTHLAESISKGINAICALNKNPIEELYEIKKFVMINLKNEKSSPQYQLQKYYPKIHNSISAFQFETMQACVKENIQRGVSQGFYRDNLDIDFISRIYYSGMTSTKDHRLFPPDKFPVTTLMDNYLEYHIRGIVTPLGRKILNKIINSNPE
ncbi:TetR/AcrR family transcriptional regulator [Zobellia galactanivorans]|uniref:TetR-type transcriptional regulator n=1 Tax=Zobellia galactanivorans (strain DSM 12802 / CCUG 47099 / CIP 106680 / NCIMB 13871 / Dsij) TaxID=63186 RepID=G0L577_ZOBGA|nr:MULTISPECIES: TetR/AcrR family transcriptional regulator [Zobellia]MBU3026502.1 TetR/AcrR family transcriptional regulator [Zobellia galactanivorans]MDO6809355.1 TetR/AcrR family transcriptional regulator [Zobellia galactanivorans]OWW26991.1 TetR family transcriptional regulator [Zobellia sp. OII3]CAZ96000.1 TetR-type transcriptional regulator [Zobellia galactanivorans]